MLYLCTMKIIEITEKQQQEAEVFYDFKCLNNSITKGQSNIYGALGEIVVRDELSKTCTVKSKATYDYDMIIKGAKIDVKTKKVNSFPQGHYLCSIASFNITQKCDYYFFVRIMEDMSLAYLLGYLSKKDFFKKALLYKKGDQDINGFVFKADNYSVEINELRKFEN